MKKLVLTFLLVGALLIGTACGLENRGTSEYENLEKLLSKRLEIQIQIPHHETYPIGSAQIKYGLKVEDGKPQKGEPVGATVNYLVAKTEKIQMSEEQLAHLLENNRSELVYGDFYHDDTVITVELFKDGLGEIASVDIIEIEGESVQYQLLKTDHVDAVLLGFDFEGVGYIVLYQLIEGNTEEDAIQFVKFFINQNR